MKRLFRKNIRFTFVLIAVILLLIFLHYIKVLKPVENLFLKLLNPLAETTYSLGNKINNYFLFKAEEKNIFKENGELKAKINELNTEIIRLKTLEEENETLKKEIKFLEEKKYNFSFARIIGKSPENSSVIILNRGKNDGIDIGFPIIVNQGVIVGKIIKVSENNSFATLLADNQSRVAASILGIDRTAGTVEGEYGLSLKMNLIPRNQIVNIDDMVITSGLEKNIPRGLIIGQVSRLTTKTHDLFQSAIIKPSVSYENLGIVSVILP
jgi:rod shape-determining protein MreC